MSDVPVSYSEVACSPEATNWKRAMDEEVDSLVGNRGVRDGWYHIEVNSASVETTIILTQIYQNRFSLCILL